MTRLLTHWRTVAFLYGMVAMISLSCAGTEYVWRDGVHYWHRADFPLRVCAEAYADGVDLHPVGYAIADTNRRLGFAAFVAASDNCRISMTVGVPVEPGHGDTAGRTHFQADGTPYAVEVFANTFGDVQLMVIQHELGHVLGLAHDDWDGSIMRPTQHTVPPCEWHGNTMSCVWAPRLTDTDRRAIRERYAP